MTRKRSAAVVATAVFAAAVLVGLALSFARVGSDAPPAASPPPRTVATPPAKAASDVVVVDGSPNVAPPAADPSPQPPPEPQPDPDPKPRPPLVGPGDLAPNPKPTIKPGLDLPLKAPSSPAKLVRVTPGPIVLGAKGMAHAGDLCLRNTGDLALHWALATDVLFKSSPLAGDLDGGQATCIKVWTVHPAFLPGMTLPLVVDSPANSVSIDVRLAD